VVARAELFSTKNRLKGIVTGETIRINTKNIVPYDERNHMNLVFLSNEVQPLHLEWGDRRHFVIWTPEKLGRDFYNEVGAEIAAGGIAALHAFLLDVDLTGFNEHTDPPMTRAKSDLITRGLDSVARFIAEWQAGEVIYGDSEKPLPFCPAGSANLYRIYLDWCKKNGEARPRAENQFSGEIVKLPGWFKGYKDRHKSHVDNAVVRQRFVVPSDAALKAAIKDGRPGYQKKEGEYSAEYFTRCFFDFNLAAGL
jgi:putative DNA primase/helicase